LPILKIWIRDRYKKVWKKSLEKWATPLILKIDVGLNYVRYKFGANEVGDLGKANNICNDSTIGIKLENKEDYESRQNLGKTELGPLRKYSAR
jgi:hypothetical protein